MSMKRRGDKPMQYVRLTTEDAVATITIDRPGTMNAISRRVYAELDDAFTAAEDDADVRVIVVANFLVGRKVHG